MLQRPFILATLVFFTTGTKAQHPFKYDNTMYKAVYLMEAFRMMDTMQSYLLLDVRSPGEFADTSQATALNIGRIHGSVNITIDSVAAHLPELKKYAGKAVFVYCSHSQRSRRVSKWLAENGFRQVYNINGGMTLANDLDAKSFPYKNRLDNPNLFYQNISSRDAYHLMVDSPGVVIIDIRTEPEFSSTDSLQQNNIGHLKNAINIPQSVFAEKIDSYHFPKNSTIILYDLDGYNSMDVVEILKQKGYTRIYNLFEGLKSFMSDHKINKSPYNQIFAAAPAYQMLDPESCIQLLKKYPNLMIIDTRPADEFNNKSSMAHQNLGHIKGAVHISSMEGMNIILRGKDKTIPILVYGSGSRLSAEICQELVHNGFQQVNFLSEGFYHLVWSVSNIEDCQTGAVYLVNHEGLY